MTATERLRALLDERGVEWASAHEWEGRTFWPNADGVNATASDYGSGLLVHAVMSPEQAVAATLVRGTCRMELPDLCGPAYTDVYVCSECGGEVMVGTVMGVSDVPKWCPWCGRKVEQ